MSKYIYIYLYLFFWLFVYFFHHRHKLEIKKCITKVCKEKLKELVKHFQGFVRSKTKHLPIQVHINEMISRLSQCTNAFLTLCMQNSWFVLVPFTYGPGQTIHFVTS